MERKEVLIECLKDSLDAYEAVFKEYELSNEAIVETVRSMAQTLYNAEVKNNTNPSKKSQDFLLKLMRGSNLTESHMKWILKVLKDRQADNYEQLVYDRFNQDEVSKAIEFLKEQK